MKKFIGMTVGAFAMFALCACSAEEPSVVAGREWNPSTQVVADTTSLFAMNEQMVVQFRYGKNFDFEKLKTTFFEGTNESKGKEIWSHEVPVNSKTGVYTLQGKSRSGGLMNAKELTRLKQGGTVHIEFSSNGLVLAYKDITVDGRK